MAQTKSPHAKHLKNINAESKEQLKTPLANLQANSDLWYKIKVLLYDLCNIAKDRAAEARTLCTTDELYISAPYFTPDEGALIKATMVSPPILSDVPEFEALEPFKDTNVEIKETRNENATPEAITIEQAIKSCLQNFFEKRRASGDARPCGLHDMGPIYRTVFGITKEELNDEKFLGRLRRGGLGQVTENALNKENSNKPKKSGRKY